MDKLFGGIMLNMILKPENPRTEELGVEAFWASKEAETTYGKFAKEVIPSNSIGIAVAHTLLVDYLMDFEKPAKVMDLGCFTGASSYRVLEALSGSFPPSSVRVTGVDTLESAVKAATCEYSQVPSSNLRFMHINESETLPMEMQGSYSGVVMFFVDQVISSNRMLKQTFRKAYEALEPGGILVILRLAEESFNPGLNYEFYRHNRHLDSRMRGMGEEFENELLLPERGADKRPLLDENGNLIKQKLIFTDHFRKRSFISSLLYSVGFTSTESIKISSDISKRRLKTAYERQKMRVLYDVPQIENSDEFNPSTPLHEIFWARK